MNPTPVAWWEQDESTLSFKTFRGGAWTPLFTAAQLNQARADALREAAENIKRLIGGDGEIWVHEVDGLLSRMAAEIEGKKK